MGSVTARRVNRPLDEAMFAPLGLGLAAFEPADGGGVTVTFAETLTPAQQLLVPLLLALPEGMSGATLRAAVTALAGNVAYLAIPAPTAAQAIAQVDALTRQVSALIRLAAGSD